MPLVHSIELLLKFACVVYRLLQIGLVGNLTGAVALMIAAVAVYRLLQIGLVGNLAVSIAWASLDATERLPITSNRISWKRGLQFVPGWHLNTNVYRLLQIGLVGNF